MINKSDPILLGRFYYFDSIQVNYLGASTRGIHTETEF